MKKDILIGQLFGFEIVLKDVPEEMIDEVKLNSTKYFEQRENSFQKEQELNTEQEAIKFMK